MANSFTKQEIVMFDSMVENFDDFLVISRECELYTPPNGQDMQRGNDRFWRPQPYIPAVYDGFDQSANFGDITGLSVPVSVAQHKSANGKMTAKDLRDPLQLQRYGDGAKKTLSSAINQAVFGVAANWGTLVSARASAATGYDDLADAGALMTEQGIPVQDRKAFYSSRDYLTMAGNIAKPQTSASPLVKTAYERAYIQTVGNFDVFENDQVKRLAAASATGVTITNTQPLYYTPVSHTTDGDGNTTNVDNRTQVISVAVTGSTIKVGDTFTIAGVNSVHHISKQDTGQLKTFRVISIKTGAGGTGTIEIAPPIVAGANGGGTKAEVEYQNVTNKPANGASITFLNVAAANVNPFFHKSALELIPGSFSVDPQDGWQVMRATTPLGVGIQYIRQGAIDDLTVKFRWDIDFGVGALQPEMMGIQLFGQS